MKCESESKGLSTEEHFNLEIEEINATRQRILEWANRERA
ncbi:MAG: hypothetical protein M2R45_03630 [Verrucomicrobia subdivision 3 bacterium]|nr:hypothetical protein [Limisphaerales bacterium]MCS1416874.1 hypothetical protein [Limisphaerales bacterium]